MFRTADKWLARFEDTTVAWLLILSVALYFSQVVSRYLFGFTFPWAEELIVTMVVWACFIGASVAVRRRTHIRLDMVVRLLPDRFQRPVALVSYALCIVFTALLFWWSTEFVLFTAGVGTRAESIDIPRYPLYACVPLGMALMTVRFLQQLWMALQPGWVPEHDDHGDHAVPEEGSL